MEACILLLVKTREKLKQNVSVTGTAHPAGTHEFISGFNLIRVAQSLVFCVVF